MGIRYTAFQGFDHSYDLHLLWYNNQWCSQCGQAECCLRGSSYMPHSAACVMQTFNIEGCQQCLVMFMAGEHDNVSSAM